MHPHGKIIAHVLAMAASAVVLAILFGCIVVVSAIGDFPPTAVLQLGAAQQTLSGTNTPSPGFSDHSVMMAARASRPLSVATHVFRRPQDRFSSRQAVTSTPVVVDPRRDRRLDLMDMAISIRWHRGTASNLPPGSE